MRKLIRPDEPEDFRLAVEKAYKQVSAGIRAADKKVEFPNLWSKFKPIYSKAQLGKCGFCEGQVFGLQYGDVEHFQPKAEVHDLVDDPERWGQEVPWASKVKGREIKDCIERPGYWWRAYSWDNYLLSCQTCNQQWKGNLFPVDGLRVLGPTTNEPGIALLLSPFDDFDPAKHFSYGRLGEITGLTAQGIATIVTCGLDRPSLRLARQGLAAMTHDCMDEVAGDLTEGELLRILRVIARVGADEHPYCGMVQTIFRQRSALTWADLNRLIEALKASATPDRPLCDC